MSRQYVKAKDLEPGTVQYLAAMYRKRKRLPTQVLKRILSEIDGLNLRVNAALVGQPYDWRLIRNLQKMLTEWSIPMVEAGLFPVAFLPVIHGKESLVITWQDPVSPAALHKPVMTAPDKVNGHPIVATQTQMVEPRHDGEDMCPPLDESVH